jgi:hypothetical protein
MVAAAARLTANTTPGESVFPTKRAANAIGFGLKPNQGATPSFRRAPFWVFFDEDMHHDHPPAGCLT